MLAVVIGMLLFLALLFGTAALLARRSRDERHPLIGSPLHWNTHTAFLLFSQPDARPDTSSGRQPLPGESKDAVFGGRGRS
jgi:hypothetical protein